MAERSKAVHSSCILERGGSSNLPHTNFFLLQPHFYLSSLYLPSLSMINPTQFNVKEIPFFFLAKCSIDKGRIGQGRMNHEDDSVEWKWRKQRKLDT